MTAIAAWEHDQIRSALAGLDAVAHECELRWGRGRLRLLVDDDLRARFDRQRRRLDESLMDKPRWNDVRPVIEAMRRGWQVLDLAAAQAGCQPLAPEVWETTLPDGRVVAVVRSIAEASGVEPTGRDVTVWTLDEVGRVIAGHSLVDAVKRRFPGATVAAVRDPTGVDGPEMEDLDDALPF